MTPIPTPDRWRRIAPLLDEALDLPPEEREAFLDRACGAEPALRHEIEDLLKADAEAGSFLGAPVDLSAVAPEPDEAPGPGVDGEGRAVTAIGSYRVIREIGRGGMGIVYEAEQRRPRRSVALKVILGGRYVDATTIRMFQREADSLARLKHPSIAAIYESGSTSDGQHFFAMELVQGQPLSRYLDESGVPRSRAARAARLALFRKIAAAIAYAHQRGVIHRDLKPSNIFVQPAAPGAADDGPGIKVLDFGLARVTDPDAAEATAITELGRIQGTLPYMSPEQVRGRRGEIDVRTDVYSLGVILCRMLTGRLPYDLDGAEFPEAARIICEQVPRLPPKGADGGARPDRDLAIIVLKALEKEPDRRYQSVAALDEDVARYLAGQPILARRASTAYQIRKLVARHTMPFAAGAMLLVALLAFAVVATLQARRIASERDRANREARTALGVSDFLIGLFKVSDPNEARGRAITAREILEKGAERIGKELADDPEVQARLMLTLGQVYTNLGLYKEALPILERSVATRQRLFGAESLETLEALDGLAFADHLQGRTAEAEQLYGRILEARRRLQGEGHPDTLAAMSGLAWVYRAEGRYADEEPLRRLVLDGRRRALGEDHPRTLLSMNELAGLYRIERRGAESEDLYRRTLESQRRVLGDDHPNTLGTMHDLANVYENLDRHGEAETLFRDALARMRRVWGDDHPMTLAAMNDFAIVFDHQERYADAELLLRDTLERRRRVLGDDHPDTLSSMSNLANIYSVEGRYAEAATLLREALGQQRRLLGEDHPDTVSTLYNLACTAALRGERETALDWLGQAVTHGWSGADQMSRDSDLKSLRGRPAFATLVARARKNPTPH